MNLPFGPSALLDLVPLLQLPAQLFLVLTCTRCSVQVGVVHVHPLCVARREHRPVARRRQIVFFQKLTQSFQLQRIVRQSRQRLAQYFLGRPMQMGDEQNETNAATDTHLVLPLFFDGPDGDLPAPWKNLDHSCFCLPLFFGGVAGTLIDKSR